MKMGADMSEKFESTLGCLFAIAFALFGLFQIYAAFIGLTHSIGSGWAIAAIVVAFFFRSSIPVVIGAFLCALYVWEWHWALAALFAAPGLALVIPAFTADIIGSLGRKNR
jgi:hypothetical protein